MAGRIMNRIVVFLLMLSVFFVGGCVRNPAESDMEAPIRFYYKVTDEGYGTVGRAIDFELYDAEGHEDDFDRILDAYFLGPQQEGLVAPFPKATNLRVAWLDGETMHIDLSDSFGALSGIDLTLACSCITMTCLQFPGVETVTIRSLGKLLDGKDTITMRADSLILDDLGPVSTTSSYQLYFSDTDNRYLIAEELQLDLSQEELPRYLLDCLLQGPQGSGLAQTVPLNTVVRELGITDGVCNVDLSAEFLRNSPKTELARRMTILSLTNTMTQLEGIDSLVLYVDGKRLSSYGSMDLTAPLTFEAAAVGPARTGLNELDADLYLYTGEGELLSRIPTRVRQSADKLVAQQVLDALLSREEQNGYRTYIPVGTGIVDVYLERKTCVVVLSPEFLDADQSMEKATRVICATIMATGEYKAVRIQIEGIPDELLPEFMSQPMVWDSSWIYGGELP
ncbi:MAG: hypothetical protein E7459_00520 [Ruminococcaceae bacterium]|nr:hypothetical protein [Oscillospiraceae bacterium]